MIRIETMAAAAASVCDEPGPDEGAEMAAAYERSREEAKLNVRAGWGDAESFDAELPPLEVTSKRRGTVIGSIVHADDSYGQATAGVRGSSPGGGTGKALGTTPFAA